MLSPTPGCADACLADCPYSRCGLLLGSDCVHLKQVDRCDEVFVVTASTPADPTGCPETGMLVTGHGRRRRLLDDVPGMTRVRVVWRSGESGCPRKTSVEQDPSLVAPLGSLTQRAVAWAIKQLRREHATIQGLAQLVKYGVAGCRARAGTAHGSRMSPAAESMNMPGITSTSAGGGRKGSTSPATVKERRTQAA